jgi:hypothetical protein
MGSSRGQISDMLQFQPDLFHVMKFEKQRKKVNLDLWVKGQKGSIEVKNIIFIYNATCLDMNKVNCDL